MGISMTVREETQALERQTMSPYAMLSAEDTGVSVA